MNSGRLRRLLRILSLLQSGRGYSSAGLATECGVARRTVFRDLQLLREAGVSVQTDAERQRYSVAGIRLRALESLTPEEALALVVLCPDVGRVVPFLSPAVTAAQKIECDLPPAVREYVRRLSGAIHVDLRPVESLAHCPHIYGQLLTAIGQRRAVRIRYDCNGGGGTTGTKLCPYRLWFTAGGWHVVGRSSLHRNICTFNLGRVVGLTILDETYSVPKGFSIERYARAFVSSTSCRDCEKAMHEHG